MYRKFVDAKSKWDIALDDSLVQKLVAEVRAGEEIGPTDLAAAIGAAGFFIQPASFELFLGAGVASEHSIEELLVSSFFFLPVEIVSSRSPLDLASEISLDKFLLAADEALGSLTGVHSRVEQKSCARSGDKSSKNFHYLKKL